MQEPEREEKKRHRRFIIKREDTDHLLRGCLREENKGWKRENWHIETGKELKNSCSVKW